ncbi:MAG: hypothetical protein AAF821_16200 [Cyanobacteria bacterium P01_D01_bin.156]
MMPDLTPYISSQDKSFSKITVGNFFSQTNWSGIKSYTKSEVQLEAETPYETVEQFFATFPWSGLGVKLPSILATEIEDDELDAVMADESDFTLDDLSALF